MQPSGKRPHSPASSSISDDRDAPVIKRVRPTVYEDDDVMHGFAPLPTDAPLLCMPSDVFTRILSFCTQSQLWDLNATSPRMRRKLLGATPHWMARLDGDRQRSRRTGCQQRPMVACMTRLEELRLYMFGSPLANDPLRPLAQMQHLSRLNLFNATQQIVCIPAMPRLKVLRLDGACRAHFLPGAFASLVSLTIGLSRGSYDAQPWDLPSLLFLRVVSTKQAFMFHVPPTVVFLDVLSENDVLGDDLAHVRILQIGAGKRDLQSPRRLRLDRFSGLLALDANGAVSGIPECLRVLWAQEYSGTAVLPSVLAVAAFGNLLPPSTTLPLVQSYTSDDPYFNLIDALQFKSLDTLCVPFDHMRRTLPSRIKTLVMDMPEPSGFSWNSDVSYDVHGSYAKARAAHPNMSVILRYASAFHFACKRYLPLELHTAIDLAQPWSIFD